MVPKFPKCKICDKDFWEICVNQNCQAKVKVFCLNCSHLSIAHL